MLENDVEGVIEVEENLFVGETDYTETVLFEPLGPDGIVFLLGPFHVVATIDSPPSTGGVGGGFFGLS